MPRARSRSSTMRLLGLLVGVGDQARRRPRGRRRASRARGRAPSPRRRAACWAPSCRSRSMRRSSGVGALDGAGARGLDRGHTGLKRGAVAGREQAPGQRARRGGQAAGDGERQRDPDEAGHRDADHLGRAQPAQPRAVGRRTGEHRREQRRKRGRPQRHHDGAERDPDDRAHEPEEEQVLPRRRVAEPRPPTLPETLRRQRPVGVGDGRAEHQRGPLALAVGAPAPQQQGEEEDRDAHREHRQAHAQADERPQHGEPERRQDDPAEHVQRVPPQLGRAELVEDGGHGRTVRRGGPVSHLAGWPARGGASPTATPQSARATTVPLVSFTAARSTPSP